MKKMQREWMRKQNGLDLNTKSVNAFDSTFAFFSNTKKDAKELSSQHTRTRQTK